MSNSEVRYGQITNQSPFQLPGQFAVYDKIINLKIITFNEKTKERSSFTIRSDYEIEYDKFGNYFFKKCKIKPEIRIEYKRVSQSTSIEVMIRVTNLHMQSATSESGGNAATKPAAGGYKIESIVAQIGYFNQFPNFMNPALGLTLDNYFNLTAPLQPMYDELHCNVLAVYPTRLPPDGETTFQCVIGNYSKTAHSSQDENDTSVKFDERTDARRYFFETISKRYFRDPDVDTSKVPRQPGTAWVRKIKNDLGEDVEIKYDGIMTDDAAQKYGVKVHLSNGVLKMFQPGSKKIPAVIPQRDNVHQALYEITSVYKSLRFVSMPDGNFIAFLYPEESATDVAAMMSLRGVRLQLSELPAVYSINYSGLRSIKCPFTPFVRPFQVIAFSTMYNTGNLVSYFYQPRSDEALFIVINYTVSFSTTGDENEMELLSTDKAEGT